jgi:histidinol-phosphate aminotransferase
MSADRPDLSVLRDDVRAISAYPVPSAVGLIKLDAMENPFPLPPGLTQQLGDRLGRTALNRYPPSDPKGLKERLARAMGVPEGMSLMLGNGSDELIHLVIQACARPDAVVLSPSPSFVMYEMSARFNRCQFVGVPLKADFSLDAPALLAAIAEHRPAVVFVSHPNNPTGNLFDRAVVERVLEAAPGVVVIADRIRGGQRRVWAMHLPANTRAELHGHRFTLRSKNTDAFVAGTFLVPDDVQLRAQNGQLLAAGQSDFLVVMTLQRGPAPAVTRAGDLIRIGAQTARFDGTKVSFGEQAQ